MKRKSLALSLATLGLLLPFSLSNSPAPVYLAISGDYLPSASLCLVDDSSDKAIVRLDLSNPTDNLIALNQVYFGDLATVAKDDTSADHYGTGWLAYWYDFPSYDKAVFLAPNSAYPSRYLSLRKEVESGHEKETQVYETLKSGGDLRFAFAGTVYSATTFAPQVDYTYAGTGVSASYDADSDQTLLSFEVNSFESQGITYNSWFYSFDYDGHRYQAPWESSYDSSSKPFLKGNHATSEITNPGVNLYLRKDVLFTSDKNIRYTGFSWNALGLLSFLLTGSFILVGVGLLVALIILLVWLLRKKKQNNKPAQ
jgi:hypothetical protein